MALKLCEQKPFQAFLRGGSSSLIWCTAPDSCTDKLLIVRSCLKGLLMVMSDTLAGTIEFKDTELALLSVLLL